MNRISQIIFLAALTGLTACAKNDAVEEAMPSDLASCAGQVIKDRYIVRYKSGRTETFQNADREKFKEEFVRPNLEKIDYIEYDQTFHVNDFVVAPPQKPDDESPKLNAIDNWGLVRIDAATAWQQGYYGQDTLVAVIDSGVDINHPQLRNRIAFNQGEVGVDTQGRDKRTNGVDDDGNGYADDFAGYDFLNRSGIYSDVVQHGTHVAGIIAAEHNDVSVSSTQVQGVAPRTRILPLKFIDPKGGTLSAALEALEYARRAQVDVINASWGGPSCAKSLSDKIKDVTGDGIIFVVAAGNSGKNLDSFPEFPAAFTHALQVTVGSSGTMDGMSNFSNYSSSLVHLFAPGFDIISTLPNNQIGRESGTSMATPFVAGALAVMKSANPQSSAEQLVDALLTSVDVNLSYQNTTHGRLNVVLAIQKIVQQ